MLAMRPTSLRFVALAGLLLACSAARAQAGPPYQTDDPDPVAYHHFEMYAFSLSDSSQHAGTEWQGPSYEMNFGLAPRAQFHFVMPIVNFFAPDGTASHGIGDTELGLKLKLLPESRLIPETGIFPFVELPTGSVAKGIGVGRTWYRVPVWFKKGFQDDKWTEYLGGGEAVVPQTGYGNYPFAGFLSQHKFTDKLVLGVELFGHGAEGQRDVAGDRAILADFGGYYAFGDHFQLLFAGGHSVVWAPETYTYLAAYWTWPRSQDEGKAGNEGHTENLFRAFTH
jgi:hypothetical protein